MEESHEFPPEDGAGFPASPVSPPSLPVPRRAAWWAWPVIALCLVPYDWVLERFDSGGAESGHAEPVPVVVDESADLALLKVQAQIVIASARLDPAAALRVRKSRRVRMDGVWESFMAELCGTGYHFFKTRRQSWRVSWRARTMSAMWMPR